VVYPLKKFRMTMTNTGSLSFPSVIRCVFPEPIVSKTTSIEASRQELWLRAAALRTLSGAEDSTTCPHKTTVETGIFPLRPQGQIGGKINLLRKQRQTNGSIRSDKTTTRPNANADFPQHAGAENVTMRAENGGSPTGNPGMAGKRYVY
jgi:hypothetical protein